MSERFNLVCSPHNECFNSFTLSALRSCWNISATIRIKVQLVTNAMSWSEYNLPENTLGFYYLPENTLGFYYLLEDTWSVYYLPKDTLSVCYFPKDTRSVYSLLEDTLSVYYLPEDTWSVSYYPEDSWSVYYLPEDTWSVYYLPENTQSVYYLPEARSSSLWLDALPGPPPSGPPNSLAILPMKGGPRSWEGLKRKGMERECLEGGGPGEGRAWEGLLEPFHAWNRIRNFLI